MANIRFGTGSKPKCVHCPRPAVGPHESWCPHSERRVDEARKARKAAALQDLRKRATDQWWARFEMRDRKESPGVTSRLTLKELPAERAESDEEYALRLGWKSVEAGRKFTKGSFVCWEDRFSSGSTR